MVQVGNNLRSMEISEVRASEQEEEFSARLTEMSKRYQEVSKFEGVIISTPLNEEVQGCW